MALPLAAMVNLAGPTVAWPGNAADPARATDLEAAELGWRPGRRAGRRALAVAFIANGKIRRQSAVAANAQLQRYISGSQRRSDIPTTHAAANSHGLLQSAASSLAALPQAAYMPAPPAYRRP